MPNEDAVLDRRAAVEALQKEGFEITYNVMAGFYSARGRKKTPRSLPPQVNPFGRPTYRWADLLVWAEATLGRKIPSVSTAVGSAGADLPLSETRPEGLGVADQLGLRVFCNSDRSVMVCVSADGSEVDLLQEHGNQQRWFKMNRI